MLSVILHNAEDTVQIGDIIRPIFIPSVSTNLTVDRAHYYEGAYEVTSLSHEMPYPLDGETEGFGTVAFIDVNQNLNSTARAAFPKEPSMEGDRHYYVSHFLILERGPDYVDPAIPVIELTEHEKEIVRLKEVNRVQMERINTLHENETHNSRVLSSKFIELKEKHNWCDEANEVAHEINEQLRGGLEIECEQDFDIEMDVVATLRTSITAIVTASSREQAESMVMEDPSNYIEEYQVTDALSWEGWENIDYDLA
jgi:hypothetical protein